MKIVINKTIMARIARKLLLAKPELIERSFKKNILLEEPMDSLLNALSWLDSVGHHGEGFNRAYQNQTLRPSFDGSMIHGVFENEGLWYKSTIRTGRLFFKFWGTGVGCLANVPEKDISNLLKDLKAISYTHPKSEYSSVFRNEYNNNAFFSWGRSTFYGCIRHEAINMSELTEPWIDSVFEKRMSHDDFFKFIQPYVVKLDLI